MTHCTGSLVVGVALALAASSPAHAQQRAPTAGSPLPVPAADGARIALPPVELRRPAFLRPEEGGLTADEAAQRAVETAPRVRRAKAAQAEAEAAADEALSAFIPRVDVSFGYTRINRIDLIPLDDTDLTFPQILDRWAVRGNLEIPLSDYLLVSLPAYDGAEAFEASAIALREAEEQDVAIRARIAYYDYVRARAALWVAEEAVTSIEATARDVQALVHSGVSPRAEYAQIQATLSRAGASVVQTEGVVASAARVLRQVIHVDDEQPLQIGEDLLSVTPGRAPTPQDLVTQAWVDRPDVRALRSALGARRALVVSRTGETLPRLALIGQLESSNPNPRQVTQGEDDDVFTNTWALSATLSWSPNDLGIGIHAIRQAEAQAAQIEADLATLRDRIEVEATKAVADYRAAFGSIDAFEQGLVAAEVALEDRRALLAAGAGTSTEFVQAQLGHVRARLDLINAFIDLRVAEARIDRIRGRALARSSR